jgi:MFS family permease
MVAGALILDYSKTLGFALVGFGLIFSIALIFRLLSARILATQYEPRLKFRKSDYFSFWEFLKKAPQTSFGRFSIYTSFMRTVVAVAGPFWAVYMLRDLGFSYVWFMAITVMGTLFQLGFYPILGKFSDRFGNVLLLKVASSFIFFTPLAWVISPYIGLGDLGVKIYLLFVPALFSGFAWAGYNLATNNYIYDSVCQGKRCFGSAYFNFMSGLGMFIGAGIGSVLALFQVSFMNPILFIILISCIGRFSVALFGTRYLREVRHVKKFSPQFITKEFHPAEGIVKEVHHLEHLVEKVEHYV